MACPSKKFEEVGLDTRRLEAFIKVVDLGSVTRAAGVLSVAQPALSQQILRLEAEFKTKLLVRSTSGVTPTEAGRVLYRYARSIQRQIEEARRNVLDGNLELSGNVTVGLAPWSSASVMAPRLLQQTRRQYPGILLHIFDIFGFAFSEMMLNGRMDLAILYGDSPPHGLSYNQFFKEEFFLVRPGAEVPEESRRATINISELNEVGLILPTTESFLRQVVERACAQAGFRAKIVAEIYSMRLLQMALSSGIGSTILPLAPALDLVKEADLAIQKIEPTVTLPMSICIPDGHGLSDAAFAVYQLLEAEVRHFRDSLNVISSK